MVALPYIFVAVEHLLEEVDVGGAQGRQVGLAVLEQEVVELLLGLHLGAELVHIHLRVSHGSIHKALTEK